MHENRTWRSDEPGRPVTERDRQACCPECGKTLGPGQVGHCSAECEVTTYSYGKCMYYAVALHELTGWPIQAIVGWQGRTFHGDNYIDHCWCLSPDGLRCDVAGPDGGRDFESSPAHIRTFPTRESFLPGLDNEHPDLQLARLAARRRFAQLPAQEAAGATERQAAPAESLPTPGC